MENQDLTQFFTTDLTNVDVSRPLLKEGVVPFTVVECKPTPTKDGTKNKLHIVLKTRFEQKSTKGEVIPAGYQLTYDRIGLTPTEDYTPKRIFEELKKFQIGCGRTGAFGEPASYIGSEISANVYVESDKQGIYEDKNGIRSWIPAAPAAKL